MGPWPLHLQAIRSQKAVLRVSSTTRPATQALRLPQTNEDSNVGLAALKDGDLTIRTISFACSEAQYLTFGPDSTTAERRSDRPAPLGSASALYQEYSCLTGNPMDPSICASGIGRIGFVERCGGDEGGSRLSKDQCVHAFKEAIGRAW